MFPAVQETSIVDLYSDSVRRRHADRPWVVMSMISSADGAMSIGGVSGGLGGRADRSVFSHLRSIADGVLVGAQTVRSECYSPLPARQTLAVVSKSANLGDSGEALVSAGNTIVVSGDVRSICRQLEGDVWILEGGPKLNAQMLEADCIDEICLTISPKFVAGAIGRIVAGETMLSATWSLVHIAHEDDFVFLRYVRVPND